jgi:hypothetical protein
MNYYVIYVLIVLVALILLNSINTPKVENFESNNEEIKNVFFTGGYDSTAVLVNLFLNTKNIIQPIYVSDPNLDNDGKKSKRKNTLYEKKAMNKILTELKKDYPYYSHRLKDLKEINKLEYDEETRKDMMLLYLNKYSIRPVRQYGGLAQICKDYKINSNLGVIKAGDTWDEIIKNFCKNQEKEDCQIDLNKSPPYFKVYSRFRFPLSHLSKKEIYLKAVKENWNKYLEYTWSCWFPKNGNPCGRCDMCRERVIPQRRID